MCSFSFSLSNSTYLGPFIVVLGGMKYRPAAPRHDMAVHIIGLGGWFTAATTYLLSKRLPSGRLLPFSDSPMAMTSGKVQSLFLYHWCEVWLSYRPVGLQFKLFSKQCWNLLLYLLSIKWHRFCCRSFLTSALLSVSLSSLPWA